MSTLKVGSRRSLRSAGMTREGSALNHNAGVAQVLVAVDEIDLTHRDQPTALMPYETVATPTGQGARPVNAEFADQEVRPHHAHVIQALIGGRGHKHLNVANH